MSARNGTSITFILLLSFLAAAYSEDLYNEQDRLRVDPLTSKEISDENIRQNAVFAYDFYTPQKPRAMQHIPPLSPKSLQYLSEAALISPEGRDSHATFYQDEDLRSSQGVLADPQAVRLLLSKLRGSPSSNFMKRDDSQLWQLSKDAQRFLDAAIPNDDARYLLSVEEDSKPTVRSLGEEGLREPGSKRSLYNALRSIKRWWGNYQRPRTNNVDRRTPENKHYTCLRNCLNAKKLLPIQCHALC